MQRKFYKALSLFFGVGLAYSQTFTTSSSNPASGSLSFSIRDESGNSPKDIRVRYTRVPKLSSLSTLAPGETYLTGTTSLGAASDGQITLIPGDYLVCADSQVVAYLDPCKWGISPSATILSGGNSHLTLTLKRGVFLRVAVADTQSFIPISPRPFAAQPVRVGVFFGNGAFLAAEPGVSAAGVTNYAMAIPIGIPLKLWLHSSYVLFSDESGTKVPETGIGPSFMASGGSDVVRNIAVSGKIPI